MKKTIPPATIRRLPLYLQTLRDISSRGAKTISSAALSEILDITPEQLRKDLTFFGKFGRKGIGYDVGELSESMEKILGLQNRWRVAIIGAGNLGTALAHYEKFPELGFELVAIFDNDKRVIGTEINGVKVYDFEKMFSVIKRKSFDIGVIAVPPESVQAVCDDLIDAGVKGIWNFSTVNPEIAEEDVVIVNENLSVGLGSLSFRLARQ